MDDNWVTSLSNAPWGEILYLTCRRLAGLLYNWPIVQQVGTSVGPGIGYTYVQSVRPSVIGMVG